ncbi:NFACT RNA binding domain-containing protein [Desulfomicrobium orale]|uniref:NFACT RNA binding domain-containing protein n=1 Tax=Desulfomicrobium orale TaxID=132132 RepID=UPI001246B26C|nr:NFACT RNA binding domain-containing protein [Desulfomicrobium orale]
MDATVFRFVAREAAGKIRGARLEKVFAPFPACWTFDLGQPGFLVVHAGKPDPFLLLSSAKPENPLQPDARAMWLRKRLRGRRVLDAVSDWPGRRMALALSPGEGSWLMLSLSEPPQLTDSLPPDFGREPEIPALEEILDNPEIWKTYPHVTPPLRRRLQVISRDEGETLLQEFRDGSSRTFYAGMDGGRMCVRLWPVSGGLVFESALDAADYACTRTLADMIRARTGEDAAASRAGKRLRRALGRLEEDERRLKTMLAGREQAQWLRAGLHALPKDARLSETLVILHGGEERTVALDPALTVRENMDRLFARAAKGERGLAQVAARRKMLLDAPLEDDSPVPVTETTTLAAKTAVPARFRDIKAAVYRSSDGFLMFRGRSAKANHQLLTRAASPFDYWLHAQNGPGAHVIVKRDFPAQEVPESTIGEAAALAALASHLKMAGCGDVLLCLVKDVRTIKGAAMGMADVRKVLRTVRAVIEPGLEQKLEIKT